MVEQLKQCVIYTRKSSDERLDQDFNTLHAQREACSAYILSQRAEGWREIATAYDDGGFSGGSLKRPAMQELIADIKAGKVDIIVVYKIDRLTRSLADFSKLMDIFDEYDVSFVSVTQSFNTSTSMGRLMLNVLLSFAQFEREVSAERIRDKFAASKKKGMWMGGMVPLGYKAQDRKLLIDDCQAPIVRLIFERYCALQSVAKLKEDIKEHCDKSRGALYSMLRNPIYIGKIKHKDKIYDGLHDGIISKELWQKTQNTLDTQKREKKTRIQNRNLLQGLLYDENGSIYSPSYTQKGKKRYRYYINQKVLQGHKTSDNTPQRLPAATIEKATINALENQFILAFALHEIEDHELIERLKNLNLDGKTIIHKAQALNKITVYADHLVLNLNRAKCHDYIHDEHDLNLPQRYQENEYRFKIPFEICKGYRGAIEAKTDEQNKSLYDLPAEQLRNLVRGCIWRERHFEGESFRKIAADEHISEAAVRKIISGSFDTLMNLHQITVNPY